MLQSSLYIWYGFLPIRPAGSHIPKNLNRRTKFYQSSLEAGGGKSHTTYTQIAKTGNKTIIVIPRINLIEEQVTLFNDKAITVHSEKDKRTSVTEPIADAIHTIQSDSTDKHVLIITHNGFIQYNRWKEILPVWDLVIDEHIEYYQLINLPVNCQNENDKFWELFRLLKKNEKISEVEFTTSAKSLFRNNSDIVTDSERFMSLYRMTANNWLMVRPEQWGKETDFISFAALLNFNMLENFTTVKFLADGFIDSPIAEYLNSYGFSFKDLNIQPYRIRSKSLAESVTIYQLAELNISNCLIQKLTPEHFSNINLAINQIANSKDTIWTTNQKNKGQFDIRGTYLTPKQSGTNEFSNMTTAVWLESMKTHAMDVNTAMLVAGFNHETLTTIQEMLGLLMLLKCLGSMKIYLIYYPEIISGSL